MKELALFTPSLEFVYQPALLSDEKEAKEADNVAPRIIVSYTNVQSFSVRFYSMDVELLFSIDPFLTALDSSETDSSNDSARSVAKAMFSYISPMATVDINCQDEQYKGQNKIAVDVPEELRSKNLYVEVISGGLKASKPVYDHSLLVQLKQTYGKLKVFDQRTGEPVKKAYVKVYAKTNSGATEFYKDGYTDIHGNFDYAAISTDQLSRTTQFAILITTVACGAVMKTANPPPQ
jgi:hypothetical protein